MKSHRDHKYCSDRPTSDRVKRRGTGKASPTLATNLKRTSSGAVAIALPEALLYGFKLGTRVWMTVTHGVVWFTRAPIGPRQGHRISRRTRRGPPLRIVRDRTSKRSAILRIRRLRERHGFRGER